MYLFFLVTDSFMLAFPIAVPCNYVRMHIVFFHCFGQWWCCVNFHQFFR